MKPESPGAQIEVSALKPDLPGATLGDESGNVGDRRAKVEDGSANLKFMAPPFPNRHTLVRKEKQP